MVLLVLGGRWRVSSLPCTHEPADLAGATAAAIEPTCLALRSPPTWPLAALHSRTRRSWGMLELCRRTHSPVRGTSGNSGSRRWREQEAVVGGRRAGGGGSGRARKRRRRVIVDSESDSDGEEETQAADAGAGASVQAALTAGRLAAGSGEGGGGGSAEGSASGGVGGLGGVRHRAAVAEARRRLGGGGKRGWVE